MITVFNGIVLKLLNGYASFSNFFLTSLRCLDICGHSYAMWVLLWNEMVFWELYCLWHSSSCLILFPIVSLVHPDAACVLMTSFSLLLPAIHRIESSRCMSNLALLWRFSVVGKRRLWSLEGVLVSRPQWKLRYHCLVWCNPILFELFAAMTRSILLEPPMHRNVRCSLLRVFRLFVLMNSFSFITKLLFFYPICVRSATGRTFWIPILAASFYILIMMSSVSWNELLSVGFDCLAERWKLSNVCHPF